MLFTFFKCPKCELGNFLPDYDLTIESYMENEFNNEHMLISLSEEPSSRPNYLIFRCASMKCNHIEKILEEDILKKIIDSWAKMAWMQSQREVRRSISIDKYFTKYILDGQLHKMISPKDLKNNPIIKAYVKAVEDAEAELIKKSNN